ncbi:MAG TPA: signal peptidase II [Clostridia bacterium]|nr:signal peptidase II [Clostridia bacterium]
MLAALIVSVLLIFDQVTKYLAQVHLKPSIREIEIINGVFSFVYVENKGAAFGILQNQRWLFLLITIPAIVVIVYLLYKCKPKLIVKVALAMILSGAIGNNIIDRIFLGYVRDFLYFKLIDFPIFNIADAAISVGATILITVIIFGKGKQLFKTTKPKIEDV